MSEREVLISHDYSHYYEQHQLVGALEVYLPLIKMDLMMEYACKAPLGTLETYICRCIKQGIITREGIMDALVLEHLLVDHLVEGLMEEDIIEEESGKLSFTKPDYALVENIKSTQYRQRAVAWCYKGLMNADKKIDAHMKSLDYTINIEKVLKQENSFYLMPNVIIDVKPEELKSLNMKMFHNLNQEEEILEVMELDILKERTILYEKHNVCFFKSMEGSVKVLVHKLVGEQEIDNAFTKTLQRLYDRSQLFNQMRYTSANGDAQLLELNKQIGMIIATQ